MKYKNEVDESIQMKTIGIITTEAIYPELEWDRDVEKEFVSEYCNSEFGLALLKQSSPDVRFVLGIGSEISESSLFMDDMIFGTNDFKCDKVLVIDPELDWKEEFESDHYTQTLKKPRLKY